MNIEEMAQAIWDAMPERGFGRRLMQEHTPGLYYALGPEGYQDLQKNIRHYGGPHFGSAINDAMDAAGWAVENMTPGADVRDLLQGSGEVMEGIEQGDWRKGASGAALMGGAMLAAPLPVSVGGARKMAEDVINARAEQMDLPVNERIQPSGQDPLFDTSQEAYERTAETFPQGRLPSPRIGDDEVLKGAMTRSQPIVDNMRDIAEVVAERSRPGLGTETQYFYNVAPIYERVIAEGFSPEEAQAFVARFGQFVGGTSPRTATDQNVRNASMLMFKDAQGISPNEVLGPGSVPMGGGVPINEKGYPMLDLHKTLSQEIVEGTADINRNPKPINFASGVAGNLQSLTADTHAIRGLVGALDEVQPGQVPRGWFKSDAAYEKYLADPSGFMANPKTITLMNDSLKSRAVNKVKRQDEYGVIDDAYRMAADSLGVTPSEAQSLAWFASGDRTNLASEAKSIPTLLDDGIDVTARSMGLEKGEVLRKLVRGEIPLMAVLPAAWVGTQMLEDEEQIQ